MIGVGWIAGSPTTAAGFYMIQNHADLLSGKVHAVPTGTRSTAAAADRDAAIQLLSATCASGLVQASPMRWWSITIPSSRAQYSKRSSRAWPHRRLGVPEEHQRQGGARQRRHQRLRANTLRAYANGFKYDWEGHLLLAEFAINNTASSLDDGLTVTPFFIGAPSGTPTLVEYR